MAKKININILGQELKGKIRNFYPYFLGFYLLSLIVSLFSKTWSSFFYWPGFYGALIFFTLLFALTFEFNFKNKNLLRQYFNSVYCRLKVIDRKTWLKIIIIAAILIFSLIKNIGVLDFLVLLYALISFFFILDSRLAAGGALVLLASCPFFLIFKEDSLAENAAIYAYYFLIITVLTQIREMKKEGKEAKL